MTFLRIAVFDLEDAPPDALEIWGDLVGSALRNNPDCLQAMISRRDNAYATVSTWTTEERFRYWMETKPYQDVIATVAARLGVTGEPEPSFLFEGDVPEEG